MQDQFCENDAHIEAHECMNDSHSFASIDGKFLSLRVRGHVCDPHFHDTYSIALVRKGNAECTIRNQVFSVSRGDVMLINPYEISFGGSEDHDFEYDVLYPSCELISDAIEFSCNDSDFPSFADMVIPKCDAVDHLFSAVDAYISDPERVATNYNIEKALAGVLTGRNLLTDEIQLSRTNRDAVVSAWVMMRDSQRNPVDLAQIAEEVGLSRYYFIRLFQRFTKMTPSAYLRQVKLANARKLIIEGSSLAGAAAEAGFSDQAHMTRLFKQTFGFTPGQLMRGINSTSNMHQTIN